MTNSQILPDPSVFFGEYKIELNGCTVALQEYVEKQVKRIDAEKEIKLIKHKIGDSHMKKPVLKHIFGEYDASMWVLYDGDAPDNIITFKSMDLQCIRTLYSVTDICFLYLYAKQFEDFLQTVEDEGITLHDKKNFYIPFIYLQEKTKCYAPVKSKSYAPSKLIEYFEKNYPEVLALDNFEECRAWYNGRFDNKVKISIKRYEKKIVEKEYRDDFAIGNVLDNKEDIILGMVNSSKSAKNYCAEGINNRKDETFFLSVNGVHKDRDILIFDEEGVDRNECFGMSYMCQCIRRNESIICLDPGRLLHHNWKKALSENGYVTKVIDLKHPEKSDTWDCIGAIRKIKDIHYMQGMASLFASIVIFNHPFYCDRDVSSLLAYANRYAFITDPAFNLVKALLLRVAADDQNTFKENTLRTVCDIMNHPDGLNYLNDYIFNPDILKGNAAEICLNSYSFFKDETHESQLVIYNRLKDSLPPDSIVDIFSKDDIDLTLPGQKPCAYFYVLPKADCYSRDYQKEPLSYHEKVAAALFASFAKYSLQNYQDELDDNLPTRVNFVLDCFDEIGSIPYFYISKAYNINFCIICRNSANLRKNYPIKWSYIESICRTTCSFNVQRLLKDIIENHRKCTCLNAACDPEAGVAIINSGRGDIYMMILDKFYKPPAGKPTVLTVG